MARSSRQPSADQHRGGRGMSVTATATPTPIAAAARQTVARPVPRLLVRRRAVRGCCSALSLRPDRSPAPTTSTRRGTLRAAILSPSSRSCSPVSAASGRERAGVVNIGLEGMMILGTWGAGVLRLPLRPVGGRRSARSSWACSVACCTRSRRSSSASTTSSPVSRSTSSALGAAQFLAEADLRRTTRRRPDASHRRSTTSADHVTVPGDLARLTTSRTRTGSSSPTWPASLAALTTNLSCSSSSS